MCECACVCVCGRGGMGGVNWQTIYNNSQNNISNRALVASCGKINANRASITNWDKIISNQKFLRNSEILKNTFFTKHLQTIAFHFKRGKTQKTIHTYGVCRPHSTQLKFSVWIIWFQNDFSCYSVFHLC